LNAHFSFASGMRFAAFLPAQQAVPRPKGLCAIGKIGLLLTCCSPGPHSPSIYEAAFDVWGRIVGYKAGLRRKT
jgi:hypothetical protein